MRPVDLDQVARALGVSTDAEIVDAITEHRANLNFCMELLMKERGLLDDIFPPASNCLARVTAALLDADLELQAVLVPAEEHMRGDY